MTQLKQNIYEEIRKQPLITKVAQTANISEQSIRLWSNKKDMRLLAYPIMRVLAEHYNVQIPELLENN
jgi:hypothetical protein